MSAHILVVEDDKSTRISIVAILEGAGYTVDAAENGEEGIAMIQRAQQTTQPYDVVITDIRMGLIDGVEVMYAARSTARAPEVIILTGFGSMDTTIAALRAGAYDYLIKPCKPDELLGYVAGAVERRSKEQRRDQAIRTISQVIGQLQYNPAQDGVAAANPAPDNGSGETRLPATPPVPAVPPGDEEADRYIRMGGLVIDTFRHTVTLHEKIVHLTPIEYELLHCLAQSHGRVLDYCEIAQHTHGNITDKGEAQSLLKTHVQNLRRKIGPDYLVSMRGTGYMLIDPTDSE